MNDILENAGYAGLALVAYTYAPGQWYVKLAAMTAALMIGDFIVPNLVNTVTGAAGAGLRGAVSEVAKKEVEAKDTKAGNG